MTTSSVSAMERKVHDKSQLLLELLDVLERSNYCDLQYIPTRKSIFGLFKEGENLLNLFTRSKHLMFYYSLFPNFYLWWITKRNHDLQFFYSFCFLSNWVEKAKVKLYMGNEWVKLALKNSVLVEEEDNYRLSYSVLPINNHLVLRDTHESYQFHEYNNQKLHNRVYVGADSIKFAFCNQKYLKKRKFRRVLELGCGTGIQLICLGNLVDHLTGIDINPRAVELTVISKKFNNMDSRLEVIQSDLFERITGQFDLILANPWFIDHEKSGLEEIPAIIERLDNFLAMGGVFAMYFGSFVKDGVDQGKKIMTSFAKEKGYEATFYRLGKTIEPDQLDRYKELNISYINSYYAIFDKNGVFSSRVVQPDIFRRIRDELYLPLQRLIAKARKI